MSHAPYIAGAFTFAFCVLAILTGWVIRSDCRVRRILKQTKSDEPV